MYYPSGTHPSREQRAVDSEHSLSAIVTVARSDYLDRAVHQEEAEARGE
jgi:hypothetical protein